METKLNIQVTSSDVVTLLVNDQIKIIEAQVKGLQDRINSILKIENDLVRFAIKEQTRLVKERYDKIIDPIVFGLSNFYKNLKIRYHRYDLEEEITEATCASFIYNYAKWEINGTSRELREPTTLKVEIEISDENENDDEIILSLLTKAIKFSKAYNDNWKKIISYRKELFDLIDQRNVFQNQLKNKDLIKEEAIAEMTRRLLSRNQDLQNDVFEIFSTMQQTRQITG